MSEYFTTRELTEFEERVHRYAKEHRVTKAAAADELRRQEMREHAQVAETADKVEAR